jgi:two-component system, NarL family, response regulator LiaR
MSSEKISVFVVDDHAMVRIGLAALIRAEDDLQWLGEAVDGEEAVRMLPGLAPHVVLMDLVMPRLGGIEATAKLKPLLPATQFVILTSLVDPFEAERAFAVGANAYLLKNASAQELVTAIRLARTGRRAMAPEITDAFIARQQHPAVGEDLTPREHQLLTLMAGGKTNQEIATELGIAVPTVKYHITNILSKLGVENRTEAALAALKHKIVKATY